MLKPILAEGNRGYAWSYQDDNRALVTAPFFAEACEFSEGLAAVKFICSWGYINTSGEVVIAPAFDDASNFCEGLARVKVGSKYGFINQTGECTISPQFLWASDFVEGLAKIKIRAYRNRGTIRNYDALLTREGQVFSRFFNVTSNGKDNSAIFYQKTAYQIAFLIDQKSVPEIFNWIRGFTLSNNQLKKLGISNDHLRHYSLNFEFAEELICLRISRSTIETLNDTEFNKIFNAQPSNELVYSEAINEFPEDVNVLQPLVLKIEGEFYQHLMNWEHWVDTDAFTGRYTYRFFNDPDDDRWISSGIYVHVFDTITHKHLYLDYSWRSENYDGPF